MMFSFIREFKRDIPFDEPAQAQKFPEHRSQPAGGGPSTRPAAGRVSVHQLQLPDDSEIVAEGINPEASAVIYDKSMSDIFRNGHYILEELVGDLRSVKLNDDVNASKYPDVAEALNAIDVQHRGFCVALSAQFSAWGVGIGDDLKSRESAAKLALSLTLAPHSDKIEELANEYPGFGALYEDSRR